MEDKVWQACKEKDFESFKNLLADDNTQINTTNSDGFRLFSQITKSVLRDELPPEFYFEILKRNDLDINFSDEKNIPAIYEFSDIMYVAYVLNRLEQEGKGMRQLRDSMAKALVERQDFNPNTQVLKTKRETYEKWLNPLGAAIQAGQTSLARILIESGKFDLNAPAYESGMIASFGPNVGKMIDEVKTVPIEIASGILNLDIISDLLDHDAKPTQKAVDEIQNMRFYDEDFYHNEKATSLVEKMSKTATK